MDNSQFIPRSIFKSSLFFRRKTEASLVNEDVSTSPFNFLEFSSPAFPFNISLGHTRPTSQWSLYEIIAPDTNRPVRDWWEEHNCSLNIPASRAPALQRKGNDLSNTEST